MGTTWTKARSHVELALLAGVSPTEKLVLAAIALHTDSQGVAWPSKERLAQITGLTPRGVRKALARLEERGYLKTTPRAGSSNLYQLNVSLLMEGGVNKVHTRGEQGSPELSNELNHELISSSSPPLSPPGVHPFPGREEEEEAKAGKPIPSEGEGLPLSLGPSQDLPRPEKEPLPEAEAERPAIPPSAESVISAVSPSFPGPVSGAIATNGPVPVGRAAEEALRQMGVRVPPRPAFSREEALAELAQRRRSAPPLRAPGSVVQGYGGNLFNRQGFAPAWRTGSCYSGAKGGESWTLVGDKKERGRVARLLS